MRGGRKEERGRGEGEMEESGGRKKVGRVRLRYDRLG